jgi:phosphomannomutase
VSELIRELPRLTMLKHNVAVEPNRLYSVLQNFRLAVEDEQLSIDQTDGIKLMFPEGWTHVRASNTESMIRIIVEAEDPAGAQKLLNWARDRLVK